MRAEEHNERYHLQKWLTNSPSTALTIRSCRNPRMKDASAELLISLVWTRVVSLTVAAEHNWTHKQQHQGGEPDCGSGTQVDTQTTTPRWWAWLWQWNTSGHEHQGGDSHNVCLSSKARLHFLQFETITACNFIQYRYLYYCWSSQKGHRYWNHSLITSTAVHVHSEWLTQLLFIHQNMSLWPHWSPVQQYTFMVNGLSCLNCTFFFYARTVNNV